MSDGTMRAMVRGAMVSWSPRQCKADALRESLVQIGLEQFAPSPETPEAALQHAMRDWGQSILKVRVFNDNAKHQFKVVPRRNGKEDGYELVDMARKRGPNGYACEAACKMDASGRVILLEGYVNMTRTQELFDHYRQQATGSAVGRSLRSLVEHLHGTCVRLAEGGMYYLPDDVVDTWGQVKDAFEQSGDTRVHRWRIELDDDAKRDIQEGIVAELTKAAGEIVEELSKGDLQERAIEGRKNKAQELRAKCRQYELILQTSLGVVHQVLDTADMCAAAAVATQESATVFETQDVFA